MKPFVVTVLSFFAIQFSFSQSMSELNKTAKNLMNDGDYENASLVFNKLFLTEPNNIQALKDFAFLSYLKRDFSKSIEISKKFIDDQSADEKDYQVLGMNYKALGNYKDCEKLYKQGLVRFPKSGVLYSELAELNIIDKKLSEALKNWEKGIEVDPNYPENYYNATILHNLNKNYFCTIVYGEIFVNLESYTTRTAEIKKTVLEAYKKILYLGDNKDPKNEFEKSVLNILGNTTETVTTASLTIIRTKFILNWFHNNYNEKFSFRLFDQQKYLIQEGLFDAYNQWLFGIAINPIQYKNWVDANLNEANSFKQFQEGRVFKLITGQYYQTN